MDINEIKPNTKIINLVGKISEVEATQTTPNGKKVQEATISDETGSTTIKFWENETDKYDAGQTIQIVTGWCSMFQDKLFVSSGKFGKIEVLE